jgi:hypothetical protein
MEDDVGGAYFALNIYGEGELDLESTCKDYLQVQRAIESVRTEVRNSGAYSTSMAFTVSPWINTGW